MFSSFHKPCVAIHKWNNPEYCSEDMGKILKYNVGTITHAHTTPDMWKHMVTRLCIANKDAYWDDVHALADAAIGGDAQNASSSPTLVAVKLLVLLLLLLLL